MAWLPAVGAYFAAAGVGLVISAVAILLAWRYLRHSLEVFQRSTSELKQNIQCFQDMLRPDDHL
jgi:hypothetical protein